MKLSPKSRLIGQTDEGCDRQYGTIDFPRDQKDARFVTCALLADADYFITGDKDFSGAHKIGKATVLPVSMFRELVCENWKIGTELVLRLPSKVLSKALLLE